MGIRAIVVSVCSILVLVCGVLLWRVATPQWEPPTQDDQILALRINSTLVDVTEVEEELALLIKELTKTKIQRWGKSGAGTDRVFVTFGDRTLRLNLIDDTRIEASINSGSYRTKVFISNPKVAAAIRKLILSGQETTETQQ